MNIVKIESATVKLCAGSAVRLSQKSKPFPQAALPLKQTALSATRDDIPTSLTSLRFGARPRHRNLVYGETPNAVIPGGLTGNLERYDLVDPKTGVKQEAYFLPQPGTGLVTAGTIIDGGSILETPETNGLFHFTEHMLFKRTGNDKDGVIFNKGEFDRLMENSHLDINAFTSWDLVAYFFYNGLAKNAVNGIKHHAAFMQNPKFDKADIDDERGTVVSEIKMYQDQMTTRLFYTTMADLYLPHPYGMSILGPEKNILTLPDKTFVDFYLKNYGPQHRKILVIGDFDKQKVLKTLSRHFNQHPERFIDEPPPARPQPAHRDAVMRRTFYEKAVNPQDALVIWAYRGPNATDVKDNMTFQLISYLLGGSDASAAYQTIREKKHLANRFMVGALSLKEGSMLEFTVNTGRNKVDAVEKQLARFIEGIQSGKLTQEELDLMKTEMKTSYLRSNAQQLHLWKGLSRMLALGTVNQLYGDRYLQTLASITRDDIQRVARKYLVPGRKIEYRVLSKSLEPQETKASNQVATGNGPVGPSDVRFSGKLPKGAKRYTTPEGMTVIFKPPMPNEPRIAVTFTIPGGKAAETNPGEILLMSRLMQKQTAAKDSARLAQFLAKNGIILSSSFGDNLTSPIQGDALQLIFTADHCNTAGGKLKLHDPQSFERIIKIASEILTRPSFTAKALNTEKEAIAADYRETVGDSPRDQAELAHIARFYPPQSRYASTLKDVNSHIDSITPQMLRKRQRQLMQPSNLTVTVVANLDEERMLQRVNALSRQLAALNGRFKRQAAALQLKPALEPRLDRNTLHAAIREENDIKQTQIFRSWPVPALNSKEERLALTLLQYVMSGGMSRRLFQTFREGEYGGLCYTTRAGYRAGASGGGRFTFYIGTPHENVPLVLCLFDEEMEKLLTHKPVTAEELQWAKDAYAKSELVENMMVEAQSMDAGLHTALDYPSKLDMYRLMKTMTPQKMNRILQRLFAGKPSLTTLLTTEDMARQLRLPANEGVDYDAWKSSHVEELIETMRAKGQSAK